MPGSDRIIADVGDDLEDEDVEMILTLVNEKKE